MSNEQLEFLGNLLLITLVFSLFADGILRLVWNKLYFTIGIPLFIQRIPVGVKNKGVPYLYLFEDEFQSSVIPSLTFKKIDSPIYGFREKYLQIRLFEYLLVMHGSLVFDSKRQQIVVRGLANWTVVWLAIYLLLERLNLLTAFPIRIINLDSFVMMIFGTSYLIQCFRFSKIGTLAAQFWSKKHFLSEDPL